MKTINLDHIAASPLLPQVKEAMIAAIQHDYANPSSAHKLGDEAADILEEARESVARLINCKTPKEIIFTSGGTECQKGARSRPGAGCKVRGGGSRGDRFYVRWNRIC